MLVYSGTEAFLLLIASSVVAEKARKLRRGTEKIGGKFRDTCDIYDDKGVACSNVEAAVVSRKHNDSDRDYC